MENESIKEKIMVYALTTIDNPYDPFDDFDHWILFDTVYAGYYSMNYFSRIYSLLFGESDETISLVEEERRKEIVIDEIIKYDFLKVYKKVYKEKEITNKELDTHA